MLAAITVNNAAHQREHAAAMKTGLERHGLAVAFTAADEPVEHADLHVTWSVKRPRVFDWRRRTGRPVLVMERGYLPNRMVYSSFGWNGLNNRASFPAAPDGSARFRRLFAHHLAPWRGAAAAARPRTALLCGQVPGDASLYGVDFAVWTAATAAVLAAAEWRVLFRPHPLLTRVGYTGHPAARPPPGAVAAPGPAFADALAAADLCVTYNSNAGVEAVLAGVPTVTLDAGAIAWPVAAHDLAAAGHTPDRSRWCADTAWRQWSLAEIAAGDAWAAAAPGAAVEGIAA